MASLTPCPIPVSPEALEIEDFEIRLSNFIDGLSEFIAS